MGDKGVFLEGSSRLLAFTGAECSHCRRMEPIIAAVEKSTGQAFEKLEVWHNAENAEVMKQHAEKLRAACGGMLGVPAFYNEKTKEALCGEVDEDTLRAWAVKGTP